MLVVVVGGVVVLVLVLVLVVGVVVVVVGVGVGVVVVPLLFFDVAYSTFLIKESY